MRKWRHTQRRARPGESDKDDITRGVRWKRLTGWLLVENRDEKVLLMADMVDGSEEKERALRWLLIAHLYGEKANNLLCAEPNNAQLVLIAPIGGREIA